MFPRPSEKLAPPKVSRERLSFVLSYRARSSGDANASPVSSASSSGATLAQARLQIEVDEYGQE